jgi:hypothetical protein
MSEEPCFLSAAELRGRIHRKEALFEASQDLLGRWPA